MSSWCLKNERTSGSDDGRWETGENHKMVKRRRTEVKRKREILAALDIADEKYTRKEMIWGGGGSGLILTGAGTRRR